MNLPLPSETQLLTEIERLREQFPQTQDLYREVCVLLFFRHGITPTANKLYQLVRKGSMSAPAEALGKFWEDLREKSRVRIEHPDLPEPLKTAAGEMAAALWSSAQQAANESLAQFRADADAVVKDAEAAAQAAQSARSAVQQSLERAGQALEQAQARVQSLEQDAAVANATIASLELQLQQAKQDNGAQQKRLDDSRQEFAAELDKLRADARLAQERLRASETRALMEIDRERTTAAKLHKELDAARAMTNHEAERHRSDMATLQNQLGDLRQRAGMLEGSLQAVTGSRDQAASESRSLHAQLTEAMTRLSLSEAESDIWRRKAEEAGREAARLKQALDAAQVRRKAKSQPRNQLD